ncbi:MAG TPA: thioredoxin domain-containing protein [Nannocystaceae bacterium]|nr:thioredoxin domain-containing protein [Nannocystaceae bacterium]
MPTPLHDELARTAVPLRSLARRLCGDELGDDLAQETMVVALTRPPAEPSIGWLRRVLRNEHRGHVRRTMRRRAREEACAKSDAFVPDPAQAQILRAMVEIVDGLDEPYRAAIGARFLEERSAAEIARTTGCPAATVRWRVQEGLRLTRRKLDERWGGRAQWVGALLPFVQLAPPTGAMTQGAEPMTKLAMLKVLTAVATVAGTATVVWSQTNTVVAQPSVEMANAAPVVAVASDPSAPQLFARPHPTAANSETIAANSETIAAAPMHVPMHGDPDDGEPPCGCDQQECDGEMPSPEAVAWVDELVADGPVGDPMDAIEKLALPGKGERDAKVSIVVCSDFDCPFCAKATETIDKIRETYGDKVAVHFLNRPLPFHDGAEPAARASLAAGAQGKFWEMHDLLFARGDMRDEKELIALAKELGLDVDRFTTDLRADATKEAVVEQQRTCLGNGAHGTPSFFINGDLVVGAQPFESFKTVIDDELAD